AAEPDEGLLHHLFGQPLVPEYMDAEAEQLHAVLAIDPSCRIVVLLSGDLGDQAYLMRAGAGPAVAPRHGPTPTESYLFTYRSVHSGFVARFHYDGPAPEKKCRTSEPNCCLVP